ncbi:MAG: phenylalanine--tRNA ligase subunit beta [Oscillospiraceae bacterium]|nr:phenylalanine--tRNA ligase subunit beta [Oscillospiraceae bacterium]
MIIPLSWLKEYVDIDITPQELEKKLFDCGFEVETLTQVGGDISGVVVGQVLSLEPIPDTHLHVCQVDCGSYGQFQICCGADNVQAGGKYPAALVGAQVYATAKDHVTIEGLMKIKKGKLRGFESHGMLCSGVEIGLNDDLYPGAEYCGLLVLPEDAELGKDIKEVTGLDDWLFDISITANRPDCMSVLGIAREVAATLGKPLKMPATDWKSDGSVLDDFKVSVEAADLCPRYQAHYVRNVKIAQSPAWMRRRLALVGIRSISNIVDITNYVLKEIGQPMHAFDLRNLEGNQILVRRAEQDELIVTLDEKEFKLNPNNLVICDAKKTVALAGIMGGLNSEIKDDTTDVVFESAKFMRDNVRKTSRALGQHSDSSQRFEKGVDEFATQLGLKRALHLIDELECGSVTDSGFSEAVTGDPTAARALTVSIASINALLGITIPDDEILRILQNLDFAPSIEGDALHVMIPPYREDIENAPDIAEELIRMYGYEHIVPTFLAAASVTNGGRNAQQNSILKLKRTLAAQGLYEAVHYSFYSPKDFDLIRLPQDAPERQAVRILNPISEDLSVMRTILAPSMVNAMIRNVRRGNDEGRLFEIAKTYHSEDAHPSQEPEEREALSIGLFDGGKLNFFDGKAVIESVAQAFRLEFTFARPENAAKYPFLHPGMCAVVLLNGEEIGWAGMMAHDLTDEQIPEHAAFLAELDLTKLRPYLNQPIQFAVLPKFPVVQRDIAILVAEDVICANLEASMKKSCKSLQKVQLFDVYKGKQIEQGKQSLAFSLWFRSDDHAFTDAEIDQFTAKILKNLGKEFEAVQR